MRLCSIKSCGRKHYGFNYCQNHYDQYKKWGDALYNPVKIRSKFINDSVPQWVNLYESGKTTVDISKMYGVSSGTVWQRLKPLGILREPGETMLSENNSQWVGDKVRYEGLHSWVRRRLVKPPLCPNCKARPPKDLANISNSYNKSTYNRDLKNWEWLCRTCHMIKDGRMERLKNRFK